MKKHVFVLLLLLLGRLTANAQFAISDYVPLKSGLVGSLWFPQVAISTVDNENYQLELRLVDPEDYTLVPQNGKMLVKFESGEVITLHHNDIEQVKDYQTSWIGNSLITEHITVDGYEIEDIDTFMKNVITKVRIELKNQDYVDVEIKDSYKNKLHNRLENAFMECVSRFESKQTMKQNFEEGF